jgi:hypothetical protein
MDQLGRGVSGCIRSTANERVPGAQKWTRSLSLDTLQLSAATVPLPKTKYPLDETYTGALVKV